MYHRFPEPSHFEAQCAHLKQYYRPVSLSEVGCWLHEGKKLPPNSVALTVDDGYRDFYTSAFPLLEAYSIPATVFLATDMLDERSCLWVDWVRVLLRASPLSSLNIDLPGSGTQVALGSREQRDRAASELNGALKRIPNDERVRFLDRLPAALGLDALPPVPEEYTPLYWDEVRLMSKRGVEFGAHTKSHPILSRLSGREEICRELAGSKARIEHETGQQVEHFCYPNGTFADFNEDTVGVLKECGYRTAVVGERGENRPGADPFRLRRLAQEPVYPAAKFAHQVAGLAR